MALDPKDQVDLEHQRLTAVANSGHEFASGADKLQYQLAVSAPYNTSAFMNNDRLAQSTKTPTHQSIQLQTGFSSAAGTPRMPGIGFGSM